jgi:hypothetical protein
MKNQKQPIAEILPDAPVDAVTLNKLIARMRGLRAQQQGLVRETEMLINWLDKTKPNTV